MLRDDFQAFRELLTDVMAYYGKDVSKFMLDLWWNACINFDFEQVEKAMQQHATDAERGQFAPKVAEGLPELCFSTLRTTGQLICIKRGETGYYPSDWDTGDKEGNVELADELNEDLGVTPIQRQAMEIGSMAGWDVPGADPKHYEESYSGQTSCANFEQKQ